jgi:hypothetical protein
MCALSSRVALIGVASTVAHTSTEALRSRVASLEVPLTVAFAPTAFRRRVAHSVAVVARVLACSGRRRVPSLMQQVNGGNQHDGGRCVGRRPARVNEAVVSVTAVGPTAGARRR